MKWMQNQGHLMVVERNRTENNFKRTRLPSRTFLFTAILVIWAAIWLLSIIGYSLKHFIASRREPKIQEHEHESLRHSSPVIKDLKRPILSGSCFFHPDEKPKLGYLGGKCVKKQNCPFRLSLTDAKDACSSTTACSGITFIPWEERYELRELDSVEETYDGQQSFLKRCPT